MPTATVTTDTTDTTPASEPTARPATSRCTGWLGAWRRLLPWPALMLAVAAAPGVAAPVALFSSIELTASAKADVRVTKTEDRESFAPADPLTDARVRASAHSTSPDGQALANIEVQTDWNGASQGSVHWNLQVGGHRNIVGGGEAGFVGNRWTYQFESAADSLFSLDYSLLGDGVSPPLGIDFMLLIDGRYAGSYQTGMAGRHEHRLVGAGPHVITMQLTPRVVALSPFEDRAFGIGAYFAWQIDEVDPVVAAAVPEPAGLWLVVIALLAAGAAARGRGVAGARGRGGAVESAT